jgi:hypothetical protein
MADTPDQPARVKMLRPLGLARIDRNEFGGAGIAVPGLAGLWDGANKHAVDHGL